MPTLGGITLVDPATGLPYKAATTEEVVYQLADPNSEIGSVLSSAQSAAQSAASDAAGSAAAAEVARDLAVEAAAHPSDPAVAALIDDPDSQVRASLSATFGTSSGVVELSTDVGNLLTFGTDLKLLLVKSAVLTTLDELGITATAAEINKLAGLLTSATELGYLDGVTSAVQPQLDGKAAIVHTHAATDISSGTLAAARIGIDTIDATKLNLATGRLTKATDLSTSGSEWTKLTFDATSASGGVTATTTGLKVPTAGTYLVAFNVIWSNTAHRRLAHIRVNDVAVSPELRVEINQTGYMASGVSSIVPLTANDNVQLWYYAAGGTLQQASLSVLQVA